MNEYTGPYFDLDTRNIVLQTKGHFVKEATEENNKYIDLEGIIDINTNEKLDIDTIISSLEQKDPLFKHSTEYIEALKEQQAKIASYREIIVSYGVKSGEQKEIEENPFQFLDLDKEVSFSELRNKWINLANFWGPDRMSPEVKKQFDIVFDEIEFPLAQDKHSWYEKILDSKPVQSKTARELTYMDESELNEYKIAYEKFKSIEDEYVQVKAAMTEHATKKMQTIHSAYGFAKKFYSKEEQETFAGYEWQEHHLFNKNLKSVHRSSLQLEGEAELRRSEDSFSLDSIAVHFDFVASNYGLAGGYDYQQYIDLHTFFAWADLTQGKELCTQLLNPIKKSFHFDDDQIEQLRVMINEGESIDIILDTFKIKKLYAADSLIITDETGVDYFKSINLYQFLESIRSGPTYKQTNVFAFHHAVRGGDFEAMSAASNYYSLGVEFTEHGSLILKYDTDNDDLDSGFKAREAHFSKTDVNLMVSLVYGNLLN